MTTIGPVAAPAGRGAPAGSTSRGHATWDTRASEPTAGRPSRAPSSASHHVRDAHELVVEAQGVQRRRVLGTRRDVAQVDRRVVHRDEVEDHGELVRGAVQDRHQRLRARRHRRGLHEHAVGRQLALVDPGDLAAAARPAPRGAPRALGRPGGRAGRRPRRPARRRARPGRTGRCPGCRRPPSAGSGRRTGRGLRRPTRGSPAGRRARSRRRRAARARPSSSPWLSVRRTSMSSESCGSASHAAHVVGIARRERGQVETRPRDLRQAVRGDPGDDVALGRRHQAGWREVPHVHRDVLEVLPTHAGALDRGGHAGD